MTHQSRAASGYRGSCHDAQRRRFLCCLCPVTHLGIQQTITDNLVHQALDMRKLINAHDCLIVPWSFAEVTASLRTPVIGQFLNFYHV